MQKRLQLGKRGRHIGQMVHHPHHDERVKRAGSQGHLVKITGDEDKARVVTPSAYGVGQHRAAVVEEHDLVVAEVKIGQAAKPGPNFGDTASLWGQKALKRDPFDGILVLASLAFPEVLSIAAALIVDYGIPAGAVESASLFGSSIAVQFAAARLFADMRAAPRRSGIQHVNGCGGSAFSLTHPL